MICTNFPLCDDRAKGGDSTASGTRHYKTIAVAFADLKVHWPIQIGLAPLRNTIFGSTLSPSQEFFLHVFALRFIFSTKESFFFAHSHLPNHGLGWSFFKASRRSFSIGVFLSWWSGSNMGCSKNRPVIKQGSVRLCCLSTLKGCLQELHQMEWHNQTTITISASSTPHQNQTIPASSIPHQLNNLVVDRDLYSFPHEPHSILQQY